MFASSAAASRLHMQLASQHPASASGKQQAPHASRIMPTVRCLRDKKNDLYVNVRIASEGSPEIRSVTLEFLGAHNDTF